MSGIIGGGGLRRTEIMTLFEQLVLSLTVTNITQCTQFHGLLHLILENNDYYIKGGIKQSIDSQALVVQNGI